MDQSTITLRVTTAPETCACRCVVSNSAVGRPIEFDEAAPRIAASRSMRAPAPVGAEAVNGFVFADRRRLIIDAIEAVVTGELQHELVSST
jgi:hypothetical protein